jgi:Family of unknown function (DUF5675)
VDISLNRTQYIAAGIFGSFVDANNNRICLTLEHAYATGNGDFMAKIPQGVYTCLRSVHELEGMSEPFETFQVMNVPHYTNILIHFGNWNCDSDGCILIGEAIASSINGQMITESKVAFQKFMDLQTGIITFTLTVNDGLG